MICECQSGRRILQLHASPLAAQFSELIDFQQGDAWQVDPASHTVDITLGDKAPWQSLTELVNFLRTILGAARFEGINARWVPQCGSEYGSCQPPTWARLVDMAPLDTTTLVDVLQHRRLESWFQPIFTAGSLDLWGYECLLRGRSPEGDLINPGQLLTWARQERLTFMLDRMCREMHIENAARMLPPNAMILINFLPTAIYDPIFCLRTTRKAVERCGIDPSRIIFEVVETEEVRDREHLSTILGYYRRAGYRVALDDVGAGYSGLMMLADLNPDLIKIDRALVRRSPESAMHRAICGSLVQLARETGKLCLAEGVETEAELAVMDSIGVQLYQGFLFGKPSAQPVTEAFAAAQPAPATHHSPRATSAVRVMHS